MGNCGGRYAVDLRDQDDAPDEEGCSDIYLTPVSETILPVQRKGERSCTGTHHCSLTRPPLCPEVQDCLKDNKYSVDGEGQQSTETQPVEQQFDTWGEVSDFSSLFDLLGGLSPFRERSSSRTECRMDFNIVSRRSIDDAKSNERG